MDKKIQKPNLTDHMCSNQMQFRFQRKCDIKVRVTLTLF